MSIEQVCVTKFLGAQIDSQLNWKNHIEYTCKKLCKCIGILSKARKKLQKFSLISLYHSLAFPYFIYCNHVWGNTYQTNSNNAVIVQKKLIRTITCSPFRAYTAPLIFANILMSLSNINIHMTCIFVYQFLDGCAPDIFNDFYTSFRNVNDHETRQACDLHVPCGRLDIRRNSIKNTWSKYVELNSRKYKKKSESINVFKQRLRNCLLDRNNIQ